ncbi:hypothetical protein ACFSUD_05235 [Sulfitobacter aestuarii]|uniref:Uncharacterized protein n=1 Tax=Sulfitobacter aestuarii TaxID=2161676 RepID=A0ABW5TZB2_9RHOB
MAALDERALKQWIDERLPMPRSMDESMSRLAEGRAVPWSIDQTAIEYHAVCAYQFLTFQEVDNARVELRLYLSGAFRDAFGSRIEAACVYAEHQMMEAFGYQ